VIGALPDRRISNFLTPDLTLLFELAETVVGAGTLNVEFGSDVGPGQLTLSDGSQNSFVAVLGHKSTVLVPLSVHNTPLDVRVLKFHLRQSRLLVFEAEISQIRTR
jgi:hypothetical protein